MKMRKVILSGSIVVLLCIYIIQLIAGGKSPVKEFKMDTEPDVITITSKANGTITLTKENNAWFENSEKYPVDTAMAESIVNSLKAVKSLSTVAKAVSNDVDERYGLDDTGKITVTAAKSGKIIRTISIGKVSSTGSQTYFRLEKDSNTQLASGNLHDIFGKSSTELRSKTVYKVKSDDITAVNVAMGAQSYAFEKAGKPAVWTIKTGSTAAADNEKIESWISELSTLVVENWEDANTPMPEKADGVVSFTAAGKTITVSVYKTGSEKNTQYLCTSSETKYPFSITKWTAERYLKQLVSLEK